MSFLRRLIGIFFLNNLPHWRFRWRTHRTTTTLFSRGISLGVISLERTRCSDNQISWEYHTAQLKKSQNFLGSVGYRTILAKHLTSFVLVAQHHLFRKQNIPYDAIMESNFPCQHQWIPPHGRF